MEDNKNCVILSKKEYDELRSRSNTPRLSIVIDFNFYKDGRYYRSYFNGECLLFPSKDKRNWDDVYFLKDKAPVMVSDDGYNWKLRSFHDNHAAYLLDEDDNIVTYCYWSYVVPIDKFNFDDTHSSILNALQ